MKYKLVPILAYIRITVWSLCVGHAVLWTTINVAAGAGTFTYLLYLLPHIHTTTQDTTIATNLDILIKFD